VKHLLQIVLALCLFGLSVGAQDLYYRSVPTGANEHVIVTGYLYQNFEVTRVIDGGVVWSERILDGCGLQYTYARDLGKYVLTFVEGEYEVMVVLDEYGYIVGAGKYMLSRQVEGVLADECG